MSVEVAPYDGPATSAREMLVAHARDSITRGSKSFAAASRLFDPVVRERAWLLYAWCRRCDDLADGQVMGHGMTVVADATERVQTVRSLTLQAVEGRITGEPEFDALGVVMREAAIPRHLPFDVIEGFALDAAEWRPRHEDDLYRYCYHVAGAVGVMMAIIMGTVPSDEAVLDRACDLGIAFQLANIARDLAEDDAAGRCYLPEDWLAEADVPPGEQLRPPYRPKLAMLANRLAAHAKLYEASGRAGATALPFRARWAVLAAAGIYGGIAREVARRGEHAWDRRVATGAAKKLGWIARSGVMACLPAHAADRSGLWTRPHA